MTVQKVQQQARIALGQNLFAVNIETAEARLLEDPWVRHVKLTRQLPNTLRVELSEYEPGALAVLGGCLYLLSRQGEPFKALDKEDPHDLPVISGISAENLAGDRQAAIGRWAVAVEVLRQYERLPLSKMYPAEEVHLAASGDVVLTVGASGIAMHLGKGPWQKKLRMAARVFERLAQKGRVPGIVFLDNQAHPERVVVRMQ
jgi:cell division protein FtsQ